MCALRGRRVGVPMVPAVRLPGLPRPQELTKAGRLRLQWMDFYHAHGRNASLTCRHFGISRDTLHRWLKRYDPGDLSSLNDHSRAPKTRRGRTTPTRTIDAVIALRDTHPEWSKYKIGFVLRQGGLRVSDSTVGRLLSAYGRVDRVKSLKRKRAASARYRRTRRPKELVAARPGDLVQVDTKHVNLPWGEKRFHFVAVDIATRMKVAAVFKTGSSRSAAAFLSIVCQRLPFPVTSVQTDNGSEYAGAFDAACRDAGIAHFFSYPRCPKQNAYVERAIRTDIEEFYLFSEVPTAIGDHNDLLRAWDRVYNEIRPHQSLGYLTPAAYYRRLTESQPPADTPEEGCQTCI